MNRDEIMQAIEAILKRGNDAEVRRKGGAVLLCVFYLFLCFLSLIILSIKKKSQSMVLYIYKREKISPRFLPTIRNWVISVALHITLLLTRV